MNKLNHILLITKSRFTELKIIEFCKNENYRLTIVKETTTLHAEITEDGPQVMLLDVAALRYEDVKIVGGIRHDNTLKDFILILIVSRSDLSIDLDLEPDDFIFEDLDRSELKSRLQLAQQKKHHSMGGKLIKVGELVIDEERFEASLDGKTLDLTYMEYGLLHFLVVHRDKVFSRETLLSRVWGQSFYGGTRTVDVHVRRLRAKMGLSHQDLIQTVRNVGYMFTGKGL